MAGVGIPVVRRGESVYRIVPFWRKIILPRWADRERLVLFWSYEWVGLGKLRRHLIEVPRDPLVFEGLEPRRALARQALVGGDQLVAGHRTGIQTSSAGVPSTQAKKRR